jgi:CubicO group peptidase (beta-lactamase class C family)
VIDGAERKKNRVKPIKDLETTLDAQTARNAPPGLSLVVVKDGAIAYSKGFGLSDGPNGIPAIPGSVYHWWSMTKIPTALAILQLQERGLLSIHDPVEKCLPYFQLRYPRAPEKAVTILNLLNHSSGLPDPVRVMGMIHQEQEPPVNQTELTRRVLSWISRLRFEPGTRSRYTNLGCMVLGTVIEAVTGQPYEEYMRQSFLRPLGMHQTDFLYSEEMRRNAAVGSHPLLNAQSLILPLFIKRFFKRFVREVRGGRMWLHRLYNDQTPSSALIGPVTDLARFLMAYLNNGELEGARILSPASIAMMTNEGHVKAGAVPGKKPPLEYSRGIGWAIADLDGLCISHGGGGAGFGCLMRLFPERSLGMVVMGNDTTAHYDAILDRAALVGW